MRVGGCLLLRLPDVRTNESVVDVIGTFNNLGGGEAGRLCAGEPDTQIVWIVGSVRFGYR